MYAICDFKKYKTAILVTHIKKECLDCRRTKATDFVSGGLEHWGTTQAPKHFCGKLWYVQSFTIVLWFSHLNGCWDIP